MARATVETMDVCNTTWNNNNEKATNYVYRYNSVAQRFTNMKL